MPELKSMYSLGLPALSRRREPRIGVAGFIAVRPASPSAPDVLAVHDLSFRGFAIDTVRAVEPRTIACYRFEAAGIRPFTAMAVAAHCHQLPGMPERWRTGWEFREQAGLEQRIEYLLDLAVGVLTIE